MIDKLVSLLLDLLPLALRRLNAPVWLIEGLVSRTKDAAPHLAALAREAIAGGALPDLRTPREPQDWAIVDAEIARALDRADTVPPEAPPTEPQGEP